MGHSLAMERQELFVVPKVQLQLLVHLGVLPLQVGQRVVVLPVLVLYRLPVGYVLRWPKGRGVQE